MQSRRLTLQELRSIPYTTENLYFWLNPHVWESEEQEDGFTYIQSHHRVLELGGCYGLASCAINQRLTDQTHHVVVEPEESVQPALIRNRDTHNSYFKVFQGIIAKQSARIEGESFNRRTVAAPDGTIVHKTVEELEAEVGFQFNCLVADCEGALEQFVRDFPELFDRLEQFMFERDRQDVCDYEFIETFLRKKGFHCIKEGFHSVWTRQ